MARGRTVQVPVHKLACVQQSVSPPYSTFTTVQMPCVSVSVHKCGSGLGVEQRAEGTACTHLIDRVRQPVVHISTSSLPVRSCERSGFLSEERTFKFLQVREYTWNCLCAKQQFACNPAVICFCVNCTILVLHFGEDKFTHSSVFVFLQ